MITETENPVIKIEIKWNNKTKLWDVGMFRLEGGFTSFNKPYLSDATKAVEEFMEYEEVWPQ